MGMRAEEEVQQLREQTKVQQEHIEAQQATIARQEEQIARLEQQVATLTQLVQALHKRLAKDSHNSSLPPSSDRFARQKKARSLRRSSGKLTGGQPGHPGATLEMSPQPDEVISLPPITLCEHCQADLSAMAPTSLERRQVVDVPLPRVQVREYRGEWKQCPHCQGYTASAFPEGVRSAVQYGPRLGAIAVYLLTQQLLPWGRTCEVLADLLGVELSEGTLARLLERCAANLSGVEQAIKQALVSAEVLHLDETGLYVTGRRYWLHVASTAQLTHYAVHKQRGKDATDAIGILPRFAGTSVHDGWRSYFRYACLHALCLVHVLRALVFLAEEEHLEWAAELKALLLDMKAATDQARASGLSSLHPVELDDWQAQFLALLAQADALTPHAQAPPGHTGKVKQSPARNLLDRLLAHQEAVLAFLHRLVVPFDNNQAERDVRMVKVQQKVSGSFRSEAGAAVFCRIRGYLSTLRKQGADLLAALEATLCGHPLLPSFEAP
jgi:transposase